MALVFRRGSPAAHRTDRGASALAAELAERALRLTPLDREDERRSRALAAGRAQLAAGEWTRARTIATDLLAEIEGGPLRAEALLLLAEFEHDDLAVPVLEEALRQAASHPRVEARIHVQLGLAQRFRNGFDGALNASRTALELADRSGDDVLTFEALLNLHALASMIGDPETQNREPVDCLLSRGASMATCTTSWPARALTAYDDVRRRVTALGVGFLATRGFVCFERSCPMVIGRTIAWLDSNHLSSAYSATLGEAFGSALNRARAGARR